MKFSGKMCLKIILKVTKNQGFSLFLEDTLLKNHREGGGGAAILGLMSEKYKKISKYLSYVELLLISLALFHLIKFLHMLH